MEQPTGLERRQREILKSVIRAHIVTGEPVGSKAISEGAGLDLSPATIRNIMAELEERELLRQPHRSAGRIPTDQAYRLYVDHWLARPRVNVAQAQAIGEALKRSQGEIAELLEEASRQLSRFSHQVGVVLAPEFGRIVVEQLEFVRLSPRRVVAVVVGKSGVVHNRILDVAEDLPQDDLDRLGRQLSDRYSGRTLPEMREALQRAMAQERANLEELRAKALELAHRAVDVGDTETAVFVEGTSNLLDSPEFADRERIQALIRTLEEKGRLVDLLARVIEGRGVQVVIGRENPLPAMADCSVVASTYGAGSRVLGRIGIVGPTRMEYARAVALVDYLAQLLTRLLSSPDDA